MARTPIEAPHRHAGDGGVAQLRPRTRRWQQFVRTWHPFIMLLYRLRLGWLTDHWLMIITHIGRRSGKIRRTIVYVQYYNRQTREAMAIAAWGVTDWYRNICATPALAIQMARSDTSPPSASWKQKRSPNWNGPSVASIRWWPAHSAG